MGRRAHGDAEVLVASNRGPLSYVTDELGRLSVRRGGGGMISALEGYEGDVTWVCAALSDADRLALRAADRGPGATGLLRAPEDAEAPTRQRVRMLDLDRVTFDRAYNGVA